MKFQRRLSEPYIVLRGEPSLRRSWIKTGWQRLTRLWAQQTLWATLVKLAVGSSEPLIEKQHNPQGKTHYTIYDPVTQQRVAGLSETEVRVWLEQRYYR